MDRDIRKYVEKCKTCQQHKVEQLKKAGPISPTHYFPPWTIMTIDIIGPLPRSKSGNKYIVVCIDLTTKWPIAIPTKNVRADTVVKALYSNVLLQWGVPEIVLSDNGVQYVSNLFKTFCNLHYHFYKLSLFFD